MAKRFTDTMKWNEDWYLDLNLPQKLFWIYICDNCDHAGIFKPNKRMFEILIGDTIDVNLFLDVVNQDKTRIEILGNGRWYLTGFIRFQYGSILNPNSRIHKSILKVLNNNDISYSQYNKELIEEPKTKGVFLGKPRTIAEAIDYFTEKGSSKIEGEKFYYFYESKGWKVGNAKMKNWKMSASGWISRNKKNKPDSDYLGSQLDAIKVK